ncbi:MAG TPA: site-2 protease family protein [Candidatus Saccharimonadia bacterium]|nr:site-2 protease family protein [Candidatus Saccharimonadia bacterium]
MLGLLASSPLEFFFSLAAIVIAITIHEASHAWMADKLGDPTARLQGRVSLNPLRHLDPLGTLAMILTRFGWGKPVEFDPYNLQNPRRDSALIALAGPASNLILATVLSVVLNFLPIPDFLGIFLIMLITINVFLAIFNFVPVHPLDGGKILVGLLPKDIANDLDKILRRYGIFILILLILPLGNSQSPVSYLITPIVSGILRLLLG